MEDFITQNALLGLLGAMLLQGLKTSKWFPFLNIPAGPSDQLQEWINRLTSIVVAGLIAVGIHYTWHYDNTTGHFDLALSGTVAGLKAGLWEWVKQWLAQHGAYKTAVVLPELLGKNHAALEELLSTLKALTLAMGKLNNGGKA